MQVVMVPAAGPDDHAIIPRVQTRQASLPMPRLPYVPLDIAEPKEVVDAVRARRGGTLLNLDRILLHSPPVAMGWNHLLGAVRRDLTLSPKLRELAMCVVAVLNGAEYEWGHHAPLFVEAGGTDAQLAAMRDPQGASRDPVLFDAAERAALALSVEMTRGVAVAEASFAAVRAALPDDRQAFELVTVIAAYNMVSRVLVAVGIEPEGH
jgi:alkylhydroperoxidase family enzyme